MTRPGLLAALLGLASCSPAPALWPSPSRSEWADLRVELTHLRDAGPRQPWAAGLRATMRQVRAGRTLDARGAIAVAPGRALRMILVGGAGATILDAWVTRDRWRVAVPPAGLLRRGGSDEPPDMPIGFLRWWFFRPLGGTLFAAHHVATPGALGSIFLLRDDDDGATVELVTGPCLHASRRAAGRTERVEDCSARAGVAQPGDHVAYEDEASGLTVDLQLESLATSPPDEEAFRDPDAPGDAG